MVRRRLKMERDCRRGLAGALRLVRVVAILGALASALPLPMHAQSTRTGPTLRHGSGLLDIPVAAVIPDRTLRLTYSGFFTAHETEPVVDDDGRIVDTRPFDDRGWRGDLSLAYGLWDLFEVGANLQSISGETEGGVLGGAFGRLAVANAVKSGLGIALGVRWANGPDFGDGIDREPTRLGVADRRFRSDVGEDGPGTGWSGYAVATVDMPGPDTPILPDHDWTLTGGWGTGMFSAGDDLEWYGITDSDGWFAGAAVHMEVTSGSVLTLETEFNGFDWNAGVELDLRGVRLGAHLLGANYGEDVSLYRSRKFGLSLSVDLCPDGLCRPTLRERPRGGTVVLPPPPPDTVLVQRGSAAGTHEGVRVELCLATGTPAVVRVSARGDTLVGEPPRPVRALRPAFEWSGSYAAGRPWYEAGEAVEFGGRRYTSIRGLVRLSCDAIERVGEFRGVGLFGMRRTDPPPTTVYLPVRPGVWRAFEVSDPGMSPPSPPF